MIGIAKLERAARHAVEAGDDRLRRKIERGKMMFHVGLQRIDIGRVVVIGRQCAQRRLPAHPGQRKEGGVVRGRGRRRAILRIERREQDAVASRRLQCAQPVRNGRPAVSHRMVDDHVRAERAFERCRLAARDGGKRRSILPPDLPIGVRRHLRSAGQHEGVQDRLPDEARQLHDARVGQELTQIAAHRRRIGRIGRAEVDD